MPPKIARVRGHGWQRDHARLRGRQDNRGLLGHILVHVFGVDLDDELVVHAPIERERSEFAMPAVVVEAYVLAAPCHVDSDPQFSSRAEPPCEIEMAAEPAERVAYLRPNLHGRSQEFPRHRQLWS